LAPLACRIGGDRDRTSPPHVSVCNRVCIRPRVSTPMDTQPCPP
jgi:hypothetical protein